MQSIEEFLKKIDEKENLNIFTDGSCLKNPDGPGGWGVFFEQGNACFEVFGGVHTTTNNRMEMQASIEALRLVPLAYKCIIFTDSTYLKNGITNWIHNWKRNGWKNSAGKPVKNQDLWMQLDALIEKRDLAWKWVRGHGICRGNIRADALARQGVVSNSFNVL